MATNKTDKLPEIIFRTQIMQEIIAVDKSTLWRWIRDGQFPAPFRLPSGRPAWRRDDVRDWLNQLGG